MTIQSVVTNRSRAETTRRRHVHTVAVDELGVRLQLRESVDVDGMLDASRAVEGWRAAQPDAADALLAGRVRRELLASGDVLHRSLSAARADLRRALSG